MDSSNIEHLKIHFLPQLEGSGDPSPSNVRNITGRTSIGYHYGSKNIFSSTHLNKTAYNIRPYYDEPLTLPAGTYTMSCSEECDEIYVNEDNEAIFTVYHKNSMTFTLTATKTIWFNFYKTDGMPDYATVLLETGSQPTLPMTGKNLFDKNNATIINGYFLPDVNYVITTSSWSKCVVFPCQPNTQYTISKMRSSRLRVGDCSTLNPAIGDTVTNYTHADSASYVTHTTGADAKNMIIWVYNKNFDTMTIEDILKTLLIEYGSVATTYQQYLSTLTITHTFPRLEKNLLPGINVHTITNSGIEMISNSNGSIHIIAPELKLGYFNAPSDAEFYLPDGTYTLSGNTYGMPTVFHGIKVYLLKWNGQKFDDILFADRGQGVTQLLTAGIYKILIYVATLADEIIDITFYPQLERGTTATTFETPKSTHEYNYKIDWDYNGTLYGGYIDVITGAVVAEYKEIVNTTWGEGTTATEFTNVERRYFTFTDNILAPGSGDIQARYRFCNVAKWSWDYNKDSIHYYTDNDYKTAYVFLPLNTPSDTPIQIVEKLVTPITIGYVTAPSIKTYEGITNIQSNANGQIECTYRFTDHLAPRRILIDTPHIETASNNLITFNTDLAANIKSLKCSFTPQQSGSGDPYAPGGGKNKWNGTFETKTLADMTWTANSDGTITVSGTPSAYSAIISDYFEINTQETICISGDLANVTNVAGDNVVLYDENKDIITTIEGGWTQYKVIDMSDYPTAKYIKISFKRAANDVASSGTIKPMLELSSSATSYAPYSNVRPITGHSDITGYINTHAYNINFPVLGDNLFDKSTGLEMQTKNLRVARNQGAGKGVPFLMKAGVTYTVYCNSATRPDEMALLVPYTATSITKVYNNSSITYTPEEDTEVGINMYWSNIDRPADATDIMIKIGSTETPFHPYFKIADGYINLITGELVVNSVLLTYNTAAMNNLESYPGWTQSSIQNIVGTNLDKTYWHGYIINIGETFSVNTKYSDILFLPKSVYGFTQTQWQALAMDIQLCVPYTTPQVIQLTPQQIKTIKGSNTIYSSTGDNVSVEYWTH